MIARFIFFCKPGVTNGEGARQCFGEQLHPREGGRERERTEGEGERGLEVSSPRCVLQEAAIRQIDGVGELGTAAALWQLHTAALQGREGPSERKRSMRGLEHLQQSPNSQSPIQLPYWESR